MEVVSHILGAFDTVASRGEVHVDAFLGELAARGFSPQDARLALERATLEGWLARSAADVLVKRHAVSAAGRWESEARSDGLDKTSSGGS